MILWNDLFFFMFTSQHLDFSNSLVSIKTVAWTKIFNWKHQNQFILGISYNDYPSINSFITFQYMNVTQTFIDVCIYNGRVLLRRLKNAKAKFTDIVTSDSYTIKVVNKHGYKIVSAALHIRDIQLSFSKDLVDSEDIYTIIVRIHYLL